MNPILMPCHGNVALTRVALASVYAQDVRGGVHVIAINDGSPDDTARYLGSLGEATVVHHLTPRGVTACWNMMLTYAFEDLKAEHALVINNDVRLRPDAYRLLLADGRGFVTCVGVRDESQMDKVDATSRSPHPDFSCFLIRRATWRKVGPFDQNMSFVCQDGDYHIRLHNAGVDAGSIVVPFFHHISASVKGAGERDRERLLQQAERDRQVFRAKWNCNMGEAGYYRLFHRHDLTGWHLREGTWDEDIVRSVIEGDEYQLPERFTSDDIIIDVGAHIGGFCYAAWLRGARRILAFEPWPENYELAWRNLAGTCGAVALRQEAVWRSDVPAGALAMTPHQNPKNTGGTEVFSALGGVVAAARPLDSIIGEQHIRFLKLDCEGAEFPILLTSQRLRQVDEIALEYHERDDADVPEHARIGKLTFTAETLISYLGCYGFTVTQHVRHPQVAGELQLGYLHLKQT